MVVVVVVVRLVLVRLIAVVIDSRNNCISSSCGGGSNSSSFSKAICRFYGFAFFYKHPVHIHKYLLRYKPVIKLSY